MGGSSGSMLLGYGRISFILFGGPQFFFHLSLLFSSFRIFYLTTNMNGTHKGYNLRSSRMAVHRHGGGPFVVSPLVGGSAPPGSSSCDAHHPRPTRTAGVGAPGKVTAKIPGCSLRAVRVVLDRIDRSRYVPTHGGNDSIAPVTCTGRMPAPALFDRVGRSTVSSIENSRARIPHIGSPSSSNRVGSISSEDSLHTSTTGLRIMQLNMRRSAVVTGEVRQLVADKRLDVLLLQEPYVRKQSQSHTFYGLGINMRIAAVRSQRPWAAVAVCNPKLDLLFVSQLSTTHCVCVEVQAPGFSFYVASCYFQYSDEIEKHLGHLEKVLHSLRGKRLLVALDANARSSLWGPQETDERGARLEELIRSFGLEVVNRLGQPPTFWTARGSSYIDVTLVSSTMNRFIGDWMVRTEWTTSDHRALDIRIRVPRAGNGDRRAANMRFNVRRADWERFAESLLDLSGSRLEMLDMSSASRVEIAAKELTAVIVEACANAMPRKKQFRKSNPWWTLGLTNLKKAAYRNRRRYLRERDHLARQESFIAFKLSLRVYRKEVRRCKVASWRDFVSKFGNEEPWGLVYKIQTDKLTVGKVLSTLRQGECSTMSLEETAKCFLDVHVPDDREAEDSLEQREIRNSARFAPDTVDAPIITEKEVADIVKTFRDNKAPGPDLVEVRVLKAVVGIIPGQLVKLFNGCLQWGVFPSVWKEGSLRVLPKGEDRDEKDPKSYRPICLLSVIGKLFEKLLKARLEASSLAPERLSDRQFGFMPGRSTEDAVVELRRLVSASSSRYVVALLFDISGAFDNVWWPLVLDSLKQRDCPKNVFEVLQSYFDDRRVTISHNSLEVSKRATRGCPQGSVLGPACWNLMFDGLLRQLEVTLYKNFVAYADDLVVVLEGNSRREIEIRGQAVATQIVEWCRFAKLKVSEKKTEAILLRTSETQRAPIGRRGGNRPDRKRKTNKRVVDFANRPPIIKIENTKIRFKNSVRYLGIHFNRGMGVGAHCSYLSAKLGSLFNRLGKLARATWGLRSRALSVIYKGVFVPTVAYAAAGWADLCTEGDIRSLRSLHRRALLNITRAYRTTSYDALCTVAGALPVDVLLRRSGEIYKARKNMDARMGQVTMPAGSVNIEDRIRSEAMNLWQARWKSSQKGRTTFAFFASVQERMAMHWVQPNFWVSQVLTGHGDFRARLMSLGLAAGDACVCGGRDTVQHFLMECASFEAQRVAMRDLVPVGEWSWPGVARFLVSTPEAYSLLADYCRETLWLKSVERE